MISTDELEVRLIKPKQTPKLLVEWSSPWREFVTAIRPALKRSERRLAGEAPFGLIPLRIMIPSYVLEAFLIFAVIFVQVKIAQLQPIVAPRFSSHDVIYYSGEELPRTTDLGGAESGVAGRAGGRDAYHRTQTIRIARGVSLVPRVVDAPNLKLPSTHDAVANLLAIRPDAGPPPSDGLRSTRTIPSLTTPLVAPAPNVIRDYTRNGVQLDGIIAPPASVSRDRVTSAPNFSASIVPPAPKVARDHPLVAPALGPSVIPPAPRVSRDHSPVAPSVSANVVAPAPNVGSDRMRAAPALNANVIPAAPGDVSRDLAHSTLRMSDPFVPPPVSAPERATSRTAKLNLPAPAVIAPPPSAAVLQGVRRPGTGSIPDSTAAVVPPPPTTNGSGSLMSSLIGKIFGGTEVVPPPPTVRQTGSNTGRTELAANVVPPPPNVNSGGNERGNRRGLGSSVGPNVIAPPPTVGVSGGSGTRPAQSSAAPTIGMPNVVAPPPTISGTSSDGNPGNKGGTPHGTLLAESVVPPPPSIAGSSSAGSGLGRSGRGAALDAGAGLAPATFEGSNHAGAVISNQPGSRLGLPTSGGTGSLGMSPSGGDKVGLGGAGNGSSISRGNDTGSGLNGVSSGAGKSGTQNGLDSHAHGGISPNSGPGGAGNAPSGTPPVRGVDISGGTGIVTIPGFGSDPPNPQAPGRTSGKQSRELGVTVVATATSGGAFEPYKNLLRGEKYTTYFDSSLGTVVMEFADESAVGHQFGGTLTAPVAIRTNLAQGLPHARMVITCRLDASGNLRNVRVLDPGPAAMVAKILAALPSWKFQPAMRGDQAVEVTAIIGFGIDTNDRF